ncbi:MAG: 3D domain-containing protein [Vicinamibacterales bacterium]
MRRVLSRSTWRKLAVTLVAVLGFVLLYDVTTIDQFLPWHTQLADPTGPVQGARLQFSATAYCKGNTTASGVEVRTGIAAADPGLLPVGSVVTVTTDDVRYNGVYTVMDTGPAVQGRELDLYMWSCKEALAFGRKPIQLTVLRLGWNPNASTPSLIDRIFRRPTRSSPAPSVEAVVPASATPPASGAEAENAEDPARNAEATAGIETSAPSPTAGGAPAMPAATPGPTAQP